MSMLVVLGCAAMWTGTVMGQDKGSDSDKSFQVIHLEHSPVQEVAAMLEQSLVHMDGISVVPDNRTNDLFIYGSQEQHDTVQALVMRLDRAPAAIDIDVAIVKLNAKALGEDRQIQLAGPIEEVKSTIARLEKAGIAEVIDRIKLTTLDDQVAQFQSGQKAPVTRGFGFGGIRDARGGTSRPMSNVSIENVGTVVTANCRESAGAVVMELSTEKSWIADEPVTTDNEESAEIGLQETQTVQVRATVRVPDGKAVIAGEREFVDDGERSRLAVIVTAKVRK